MAVSGVSSSSSIYGNRNVITGLVSGMDTESMIENVISSYKTKIATLTQKRTKTEWKQEAYRSMINKMSTFADKYTSYRSSNNLMSASFFDSAVKTVSKGANADKVTATGKASSNVQIDRVLQMATAATYKLSGSALDGTTSAFGNDKVVSAASGSMDLDEMMKVSSLNGTMTLAYGGSSALSYLSVSFDETKTYTDAQDLADEINRQLSEQTVNIGSASYTGDDLLNKVIKAEVKDGKITFSDPKKNNVYVSSATGTVENLLLGGKEPSSKSDSQIKELTLSPNALSNTSMSKYTYLMNKGGSMEITLDGVTKTVRLPTIGEVANKVDSSYANAKNLKTSIKSCAVLTNEDDKQARDKAFMDAFQANVDAAFGKGKLTVSDGQDGSGIKFQFEAAKGSTFSVVSSKGETLGFGESDRVTSYLNTSKTLGELLKGKSADGTVDWSKFEEAYVLDSNGNKTSELAKDSNGKQLYSFKVNGKEIGQFNEDTTLNAIFNTMNSSSDSGVKVGYSKLTNELTFTAKDTGSASQINFAGLSAELFGAPGTYDDTGVGTYTKGQDAIFEASVNGTSMGTLTRSTNTFDMDGLSVTLKGTFGYQTDEDGNIQYDVIQSNKDSNGNPLFNIYQGQGQEKQVSGEQQDDGRYKFTDEKTGKTVYGTMGSDGKMTFEHENGKTVYAQVDGSGRLRFTEDQSQGQEMSAVAEKKVAIVDKKAEAVTFETSADADKIVDAVKAMVEDYNAMVTEIKNAYSTLPVQRSNGAYYEPLTDDEKEGMSESTIESWEENAKTGILFGDRTLANLYSSLTSAISMNGEYGAALRSAGITVNYSNGLSTLSFEEDKFRAALNSDPDKVRDAFTANTENGAKSKGLMQALKQPLDTYGKTSGGKGILVEYAGSPLAPSTMYSNSIQTELNNIDEQIEKWQDKMSDQVDYYTNKFSQLEQLIQQMNSQSSYFSQLMGG